MSEYEVPDQVPTLGEMVESCRHNAEVADWQVRAVRKKLADLMPGPDRTQALLQLSVHKAEFEHWSSYLLYYRVRASKEGEHVRPKIKLGLKLEPPTRREVQEDLEPLPF